LFPKLVPLSDSRSPRGQRGGVSPPALPNAKAQQQVQCGGLGLPRGVAGPELEPELLPLVVALGTEPPPLKAPKSRRPNMFATAEPHSSRWVWRALPH
jgi:hypothetical protein